MKTGLALVTIVALGCWGCDTAQNVTCFEFDGEQVCVEDANPNQCGVEGLSYGISTSPSAWNNGKDLNGVVLNAMTFNGIEANALNAYLNLNGDSIRGTTLVGVTVPAPLRKGEQRIGSVVTGATDAGELLRLTVIGVERDEESGVITFALGLGDNVNICGEGGQGQFVPGTWDAFGARSNSIEVAGRTFDHTFSCTNGVIAKCVRWGYDPATVGADLHQTCTRMARADYCGDGVPHTENGTLIDIADQSGINALSDDTGEFVFEAGWGPDGAICVNKPRYYDLDKSNQALAPSCWNSLPRCKSWDAAQEQGALTGDASRPAVRHICG